MVTVVSYNMACCYQRTGSLEDCIAYLNETLVNLGDPLPNSTSVCNKSQDEEKKEQKKIQKKYNVSMKIQKLRYKCKCHLQLCAVMSQLNRHEEALNNGKLAVRFCQELIKNSKYLCNDYVFKVNKNKMERETKKHSENSSISECFQSVDQGTAINVKRSNDEKGNETLER